MDAPNGAVPLGNALPSGHVLMTVAVGSSFGIVREKGEQNAIADMGSGLQFRRASCLCMRLEGWLERASPVALCKQQHEHC